MAGASLQRKYSDTLIDLQPQPDGKLQAALLRFFLVKLFCGAEAVMIIRKAQGARTHSFVALFVVVGVLAATAQNSTTPPDSPGTVAQAQKATASGSTQEQMAADSQPAKPPSDNAPDQKPLGTAAAEKPATTGVAASDAAGAAIAPAKQRRARSLLIKVGAIVGAGVAVGAVAALSSASPNRPPGSH